MAKKKRLLWQLFPSYLLITLISLLIVTWYASRSLKHFFLEQTASDLEVRAHLLEKQILEYLNPLDAESADLLCKETGKRASTRITIILPSGEVIGDSEENPANMDTHIDRPEVIQALSGRLGTSIRYSRTLEKNMMYVGVPIKNNSQILAVVRTSIPVSAIDEALKSIQNKILIGGLIIAAIAAILSLLISRNITRPIELIKKWAESIAQGEFQSRPPLDGSEEISGLSQAMNQMAIQLRDRIDTIMRQRNEIEAMFSSMIEGVIAVDTEEHIISMNQAAAKMFACNPSEVQGRSIQEVIRNTIMHQFVKDALSSQEPVEKDINLYSDGERILNTHGTVLRDANMGRIGALIVFNDVTRLRRLENIRRDFVANVSHEIKTPITAIKGFVETLRYGEVKNPEEAKRFLNIVGKHVDRLEAIIEDLLTLSKIEQDTEREETVLTEGRIKDVLQIAIQLCVTKATAKNIQIRLSCKQAITAKINSALIEQAVINLLDNAIKYSDAHSVVQVRARQTERETIIGVHDQGCGIDKEHLPRIFERFYRVDKARSRKMGGTGLGLAIVKHITQAHAGRVSIESTPGKGSIFEIHLPRA
ncbi:MAG: PAS domain-containing protein [Deltaproteobacteria bacterium]|nr:PAS domain-containing protein [Deltaproteobacteria bacterium]